MGKFDWFWRRAAPKECEKKADEIVATTDNLLAERGFCLWKCHTLGGRKLYVTIDREIELPDNHYPVYTLDELEMLSRSSSLGTELIVYEAKRKFGAIVTSVEKRRN